MQLSNQSAPQCVVSAIGHNVQDKIEQEVTGNGVTSTVQYCPASGRMIRIKAQRSSGFVLQDLHLEETIGLENHHSEMHRVFLGNKLNGKSTARVLKGFGLRATGVERKNEHGCKIFILPPCLIFSGPTLAWKSAVKRTIASRKPNGGNASRVERS